MDTIYDTNTKGGIMGMLRKLETITNARGEKHETIPTGGIEYHWTIIGVYTYSRIFCRSPCVDF